LEACADDTDADGYVGCATALNEDSFITAIWDATESANYADGEVCEGLEYIAYGGFIPDCLVHIASTLDVSA